MVVARLSYRLPPTFKLMKVDELVGGDVDNRHGAQCKGQEVAVGVGVGVVVLTDGSAAGSTEIDFENDNS